MNLILPLPLERPYSCLCAGPGCGAFFASHYQAAPFCADCLRRADSGCLVLDAAEVHAGETEEERILRQIRRDRARRHAWDRTVLGVWLAVGLIVLLAVTVVFAAARGGV